MPILPSPLLERPAAATLRRAVVGHRGLRDEHSEGNTLDAVRRAADGGARWVEVDVRRTRDGVLVLHHDARVGSPLPGVAGAFVGGRRISDLTYVELAAALGHQPERLEPVLAEARRRGVAVDVELKEGGYEREVVAAARRHLPDGMLAFTSFGADVVRAVEQVDRRLVTGLLQWKMPVVGHVRELLDPDHPLERARTVGADFAAVSDAMASARLLAASSAAGMPMAVWTVNDLERAQQLLAHPGVIAVITDDPAGVLQASARDAASSSNQASPSSTAARS